MFQINEITQNCVKFVKSYKCHQTFKIISNAAEILISMKLYEIVRTVINSGKPQIMIRFVVRVT